MLPQPSFNRKIRRVGTTFLTFASCLTLLLAACAPVTSSSYNPIVKVIPPADTSVKVTTTGSPVVTQGEQQQGAAPVLTPNPNPTIITPAPAPTSPTLQLQWFGHSTFLITSSTGTKILIDPVNNTTGYRITPITGVDAVTISHEHGDHTNLNFAPNATTVLRGLAPGGWNPVNQTVKDVKIFSIGSSALPQYHDNVSGAQRGRNSIFVYQVDGLRIAHLGDLGHSLSPDAVQAIGQVDVVMIPVGGAYTIDAAAATAVVDQLKPKIVVPMHYKTPVMSANWPGASADAFLAGKNVQRPNSTTLSISKTTLPAQTTVIVPNYQ